MRDRCRQMEDLLIASTLHPLAPEDDAALKQHLNECSECRQYHRVLQEDDRRLTALVEATGAIMPQLEDRIMDTAKHERNPSTKARRFIASNWLRYAAAATLLVALLVIWYQMGHQGSSGVAWAQVVARVEQAQDYICRIERESNVGQDLDIIQYCSGNHGLRQDMYIDDSHDATLIIDPECNQLVTLIHRDRRYMIMELTAEELAATISGSSAQDFVARFRAMDFAELRTRKIDGVKVSGIEIKTQEVWGGVFDEGCARLWVDAATQWPVRLEFEGRADGGKIRFRQVMKDFQWNAPLSRADFLVDIPADYKNSGTIQVAEISEETAIAGLRAYAQLMEGQYPRGLVAATAIHQFEELQEQGRIDKEALRNLMTIQQSCNFYAQLQKEGRDPAYYGDEVTARDFERVLLRWRLESGAYRVYYGDLRSEEVTAARLHALEER